jgi:hypothetical protein
MVRRLALLLPVTLACAACDDGRATAPRRATLDAGSLAPLACTPNLDGKIDADELAQRLDVEGTYLVNPPEHERSVDLAGAALPDGRRAWRFDGEDPDDGIVRLGARAVAGAWYAETFTAAAEANGFVVPYDTAGRLHAVYTHSPEAVLLHGFASSEADPPEGQTLFTYEPPVVVYRFPLVVGASWQTEASIKSGVVRGMPYAARETHEVSVAAAGEVALPDLFVTHALQVRLDVKTVPMVGTPTNRRRALFLFECLGEVARATSREGEPDGDFRRASEIRRLALP